MARKTPTKARASVAVTTPDMAVSSSRRAARSKVVYKEETETEPDSSSSESEVRSDDYAAQEEEEEEPDEDIEEDDVESLSSEDLDSTPKRKKRKSTGGSANGSKRARTVAKKDGPTDQSRWQDEDEAEEDHDEDDIQLEEGQVIAGRIRPAPTSGHVPAGQISRNTFRWMVNLQDEKKNDREWFKLHDPSFRMAEKEWVAFVTVLSAKMRKIDEELPAMPPKDLIHRIYRDVRFSSDKTPYKQNFSMSISRSGRKGIWAGYFISIKPNNGSIIAGGLWQPGKDELTSIRQAIQTDSSPFREVISDPRFEKLFGPAKPSTKGKSLRSNVFGHDDALKVAPKGIAKDHADIDLLKLRSIAVVHRFDDDTVLSVKFVEEILKVVEVMVPFIHCLNGMVALPGQED